MVGRFLVTLLGLLLVGWIAVIINFHNVAIHIDHEMDHIESLRKSSLDIILLTKQQDEESGMHSPQTETVH